MNAEVVRIPVCLPHGNRKRGEDFAVTVSYRHGKTGQIGIHLGIVGGIALNPHLGERSSQSARIGQGVRGQGSPPSFATWLSSSSAFPNDCDDGVAMPLLYPTSLTM